MKQLLLLAAALLVAGRAAAAPPRFVVDGSLQPAAEVERAAKAAWTDIEQRVQTSAQWTPQPPRSTLTLRRDTHLPPGQSGASTAGTTRLRQNRDGVLDDALRLALRHELAHQFLWMECPASAHDQLFHEAFAVATSGELSAWTEGRYLNLTTATAQLATAASLDDRNARRALARILSESTSAAGALPGVLTERLRRCAAGGSWDPLTIEELTASVVPSVGDAFVILNRHSGEFLVTEGDSQRPMPLGSTLKPFLVAGVRARNGEEPRLAPEPGNPEWACGQKSAEPMDLETALLRSCNGYFLEWAKQDPSIAQFGAFGAALKAVGISRLPADVTEAIGLRPTLALSPAALAQAYRLLAESRPELIQLLHQNARRGTLSELSVSKALENFGTKTGTVRDAQSRPTVGWIVAINDDLIAVMARRQKMPRSFAAELASRLQPSQAQKATEVQVFGLLPPDQVEVKCPRLGFVAKASGPEPVPVGFAKLLSLVQRGTAICLGMPWLVRLPNAPKPREYAGVFRYDPAPAYDGRTDLEASERAEKARRGSDFIFRTSLARYAAGVVLAEDAQLTGSGREALLRVVAHNAREHRHSGRPVCDTTHCQAFQGTAPPQRGDEQAISRDVPNASGWLLFSQGGAEPWVRNRGVAEVEAVLGHGATALHFADGRIRFSRQSTDGELFDESLSVSCDDLRLPLKLPSCPERARREHGRFVFAGHGRGHGQGLDVEHAKQSKQSADRILQEAFRH